MTATTVARTAQAISGRFFEGDVIFNLQDSSGNWGKWIGPINNTKLGINPGAGTLTSRKSRMRGTRGQILDSVVSDFAEPTLALQFDEVNDELFALAFRGSLVTITQNSGTATNVVTDVNEKGSWLQLPKSNISATGFSGKTSADVALVADTDYVIEAKWLDHGLVWIPAASAAGVGAKWSYTYGAVSGNQVKGNQLNQTKLWVKGVLSDLVSGNDFYVEVYEATVSQGNEIDFAASGFMAPQYTGTCTTPTGYDAPYIIERRVLA